MLTSMTATNTRSTVEPFAYSELETSVAQEAKAIAERIRARNQAAVIDTGRDFVRMKDRLGHGHFIRWLDAEFSMTARTAQRYMGAAAAFHDKCELVSYLPPSELYALSAPSTPAHVRQEFLQRLEAGERLSPTIVRAMVRRAKKERREHPGTGRAADQQVPESKASEETCRTAAIEGCTQETQAGQPDGVANVAADDIRAAADIIVYGLGEELSRLLQVLGEHASITRQDLIAASARASRQKGLSEAHARAVAQTPGLPKT